ncbi:MAG: type II and III secretion system protein, partial [Methylotenera sp.]
FPSGVNSTNGGGNNVPRQAEQIVPVTQAQPVVITPQAVQADQAKTDKEFANQVLQQSIESNGSNDAKSNP